MAQLKINKAVGKNAFACPTLRKLEQKTPSAVRNKVSSRVATAASGDNSLMNKVKSHAQKSCEAIKIAPLPKKESEALAKIVKDGASVGVPLTLKSVDIDSSGRFVAHMDIPDFVTPDSSTKAAVKKRLTAKVSEFVANSASWQKIAPEKLIYKSFRKFQLLQNIPSYNAKHTQDLRIHRVPSNPVVKKLISAIAFKAPTFGSKSSMALLDFINKVETNQSMANIMHAFENLALAHIKEPALKDGDINFVKSIGEIIEGTESLEIVKRLNGDINSTAKSYGVDPFLIMAIIYEEQSHEFPPRGIEHFLEENDIYGDTVGLGQITVGLHGFTREQLSDEKMNIKAIAVHLNSLTKKPLIQMNAPIASLATRYNCGGCKSINAYGRRVVSYYMNFKEGKWKKL